MLPICTWAFIPYPMDKGNIPADTSPKMSDSPPINTYQLTSNLHSGMRPQQAAPRNVKILTDMTFKLVLNEYMSLIVNFNLILKLQIIFKFIFKITIKSCNPLRIKKCKICILTTLLKTYSYQNNC